MENFSCFGVRRTAWLAILPALAAFAWAAEARTVQDHRDPSRAGRIDTLTVTPVVELVLTYAPGQAATCATSNLSASADPVIHVLEFKTFAGPVVELARGDDAGADLNARVDFTAPADGRVRLVMRAASAFRAAGTADLTCTGFQPMRGLNVGGAFKRIEAYRKRDTLMTVPLPAGPLFVTGYILDLQGKMLRRHLPGAEGTVFLDATGERPASFQVMLGSYAGDIRLAPASPGRLPIRDGTAVRPSTVAPATPAPAAGPRGPRVTDVRVEPGVIAPIERAPDPPGDVRLVRNDLYIEGHDPDVDGLGTELEANIGTCSKRSGIAGNWECSRAFDARDTDGDGLTDRDELIGIVHKAPYQWLPRWGADPRHKDLFLEVDFMLRARNEAPRRLSREKALAIAAMYGDPEQSPLFRLAHAQALQNPDLKAGISLHLDTGEAPPPNAPIAELTTYGNWGGYNAVPAICQGPVVGIARLRPGADRAPLETCRGANAADVWQTMMHANRRGVFHYVLGYPGSGGQAQIHTFRLNMPIDDAAIAAHELGHTLGITHGGPEGIGPDANCKPNYPSLMSYAYVGRAEFVNSFSDGYGRAALRNVELRERGAVGQPASGPGRAYLAHLRDIFHYTVDLAAGDVDWNRDGVISAAPVRAYANNDHSSCEYTRVNAMKTVGLADGAPALARLSGRTFVLYIDERDRRLHAETTDDALACPTIGTGCGPALVHRAIDQPWNAGLLAFDAQRIAGGRLVVVFRTAGGLFETTMTRDLVFTAPVVIATQAPAVGEFSLAGSGAALWLAFRDAAGAARLKFRASSGAWGPDEIVTDIGGAPIAPIAPGSAPGLLHVAQAGGVLYGVFPVGANGGLRLYTRAAALTGRWTRSPWTMFEGMSIGRPALSLEPVAAGSPLPGRLRILYLQRRADGNQIVRIKTLEAIGLGAGAQRELTDEIHDNVWFYGKGVDLLFEPGVDTNLRAAVATAIMPASGPAPHVIELRPKADGAVDFTYRNWNDWEALGIDLCRTLKLGGAKVNCLAWPYKPPPQPTPPPPPQPQPPRPSPECLAQCRDLVESCRAAGESAGVCVRQGAQCRAQCAP